MREIQHVVDDSEQELAARPDVARIFAIALIDGSETFLRPCIRKTDDGVQRRSKLVARIGQEHGFWPRPRRASLGGLQPRPQHDELKRCQEGEAGKRHGRGRVGELSARSRGAPFQITKRRGIDVDERDIGEIRTR